MKDSVKGISYEEYLDKYGTLTYSNVGVSMLPLLRQGRDLFVVRKKDASERCCIGDVVLYRRPPESYVLHRIAEVRPNDYVMLGDNCINREYGIKDEDILGVMTGFIRDGKEYSVTDKGYRAYSYIWLHTSQARIFCTRAVLRTKRMLRGFRHER